MSTTYLSLHVHDDHGVGAVAHHEVLRVLGQQSHIVHGDVATGRRPQRLEGTGALGGLHVPHLRIRKDQGDLRCVHTNTKAIVVLQYRRVSS